MKKSAIISILLIGLALSGPLGAQEPTRIGTTAANFLEIGYGTAGSAMGDAYVSMARDLSALYWNPAGLADMQKNQALFVYQPWIAGIKTSFAGVGLNLHNYGTLSLGFTSVNYGDMKVTTMAMQEGTGELFSASDMAFSLAYARKLTNWFSFGGAAKYINSSIWHTDASAMAIDLGVIINTYFFSPNGRREQGLHIGMSISNYGSRLRYDGIDLINPIDILADENGNFSDVPGRFHLSEWELPLIFRLGASLTPFYTDHHEMILSLDAIHPNNNNESINLGAQYAFTSAGFGRLFLRGGYKALFMNRSEFGPTFGAGVETFLLGNAGVKIDYAWRDVGLLGNINTFGVMVMF
ncbi:MAG TPA: PorV/PorQ family protein [bacterium]|nr:PorV/PorQ family protein [bacterium]HOH07093.1 PorV/PorQ family protein [bacterium]HOY43842.1 PorV/PorQ family protein [bacterium]HPG83746.1 PorV/PorQ family protein [bacterium]HPM59262.1 PorV/PorQ family protein [bacterium]